MTKCLVQDCKSDMETNWGFTVSEKPTASLGTEHRDFFICLACVSELKAPKLSAQVHIQNIMVRRAVAKELEQ